MEDQLEGDLTTDGAGEEELSLMTSFTRHFWQQTWKHWIIFGSVQVSRQMEHS